ncbi:MAG TPA: hypothetical protein VJS12_16300 [Steroidobacteraceae bacterium]|nr:hypothetical protein [Steroidobacteraceae bacterium]
MGRRFPAWIASGLILAGGAACAADSPPDIQGIWTAGTLTPFERPPQAATQVPEGDRDEHQRVAAEKFWAAGHKAGEVGRDNDAFIDQDLKILPNGQTSLVVEPADGRVPVRPEAARRRDFNLSNFDSYETMSQWDRCITREPTPMFPGVYNNSYQIVQVPGYVLIVAEMIHDARIIPIGHGSHADARVRSWGGDSLGHWEGKTLVVDTTNFNDRGWIATAQGAPGVRGIPVSERLHTVERFTPVDHDTMQYEITIEDPANYTAPWKVAYPLARDDKYQVFEYACHEGNRAIELMLGGARAQERTSKN